MFGAYLRLVHNDAQKCQKGPQKLPKAPPKPPQGSPKGAQSRPKGTIGGPFGTLGGGPLAHFGLQMGTLGPSSAPFGGVLGPSRSTLVAPGDIWDQNCPKSVDVDTIWGDFGGVLWEGFQEASERKVPRIALGSAARP